MRGYDTMEVFPLQVRSACLSARRLDENKPVIYIIPVAAYAAHLNRLLTKLFRMKKQQKKEPKKAEAKMKFKPAGDRVLVQPDTAAEEKTASGIYIPDTAKKEKPETGRVVAVGEGKRNEKGDVLTMRYKVGDKVMFSKYGYDEITIADQEYYVISESNILGTF